MLFVSLLVVPVSLHQLAACLGLRSHERWHKLRERIKDSETLWDEDWRDALAWSNLSLSLSSPVKYPVKSYTSAAIWQLHAVFNVVSHCNMISCPELQIDRTAHTGNGLNQSAGN